MILGFSRAARSEILNSTAKHPIPTQHLVLYRQPHPAPNRLLRAPLVLHAFVGGALFRPLPPNRGVCHEGIDEVADCQ